MMPSSRRPSLAHRLADSRQGDDGRLGQLGAWLRAWLRAWIRPGSRPATGAKWRILNRSGPVLNRLFTLFLKSRHLRTPRPLSRLLPSHTAQRQGQRLGYAAPLEVIWARNEIWRSVESERPPSR